MSLAPWLTQRLACPFDGCGHPLSYDGGRADGVLTCTECEAPYPVLGGIPILAPLATDYVGRHREAILALLAEGGFASDMAVGLCATFAAPARDATPQRFAPAETHHDPASPPSGTDQADGFGDWLHSATRQGLSRVIPTLLSGPLGATLELSGNGVGLAAELVHQSGGYLVADLNLRGVMAARDRGLDDGWPLLGIAADARCLPLATGAFDTVVLHGPAVALAEVRRVLKRGGRLVVTSASPDLSTGDDSALANLMAQSGFTVRTVVDGVAAVEGHTPRDFRLRFHQVLLAS